MSLQGVLRDFGAADVFQLIAQQRKTGVLEVENDAVTLIVTFKDGPVVRARPAEAGPDEALASLLLRTAAVSETDLAEARRTQSETLDPLAHVLEEQGLVAKGVVEQIARLLSEEAIFPLLLWDDGRFAFRASSVCEETGDLVMGPEMLLLDAMRMRDEWPQIQAVLPSLALVLAHKVDNAVYMQKRPEIARETSIAGEGLDRLFIHCDGRLTARRAIDLSRLGTFQGAQGLVALLKDDLIEIKHQARKPRSAAATLPARRQGLSPMLWVPVAAGLVAAGLVAAMLWLLR